MVVRRGVILLLVAGIVALAGCGATQGGARHGDGPKAGAVTAIGTPTPDAPSDIATATNAGPSAGAEVTIATDRGVYAPMDRVRVTVINHLSTSVSAADGKAGCSILGLQVRTAQGWQGTSASRCTQEQPEQIIQIAPGASYTAEITGVPAGTYRLALGYSTYTIPPPLGVAPAASRASGPLVLVYSAAWQVRDA